MIKKFTLLFYIASGILLFSFFLLWIDIAPLDIHLRGATIPIELPKIFQKYHITSQINLSYVLIISYLLYLLPILSATHIITRLLRWNKWFFRLDYTVAFITVIVTYLITKAIDPSAPHFITFAFWTTTAFAVIGLLLQIAQFRFLRTRP